MKPFRFLITYIYGLTLLLSSMQLYAINLADPDTALQQYIDHDDGQFNMQHLVSIPGTGYTAHVYQLTSQQWLTDTEIDRSIWTHNLVMIIPDTVATQTGLLYVGGADNTDPLPDASSPTVQIITQLALGSQSIVSAVFQVPNQPITFNDENLPRKEDELVALSWKKAMDTGNYEYVAYLPMTKTVVKAMDGIQSVVSDHGSYQINDFVLTGFSKRGAVVWLTAATDQRVKAIAPGVIDFLNIQPSFEHHFKSYGTFSSAIDEYVELGIINKIRSPEFDDLVKVIDPYSYRDQLTMPKFILNSSGDQFFLPDSSRFYLHDLAGETHIRFAPNTDHSLDNSQTGVADSLYSLLGWYQSILYGVPRPDIQWQLDNGVLTSNTSQVPAIVKVWTAYNVNVRDFRKETIGESWVSSIIAPDVNGQYTVTLPSSNEGYHATYIEFIYQGLAGLPLTFSTQVYVTPDVYPYVLENPVLDPKPPHYWHSQVKNILKNKASDIDADTLISYLPIPLFDDIVNDVLSVKKALSLSGFSLNKELAERECMATRLNIESGDMGWYSDIDLGRHLGEKDLWEHYQLANEQIETLPILSSFICHQLNQQ